MDDQIRHKIVELVKARGFSKSICPSEVARSLSPDNWRPLMDEVRLQGVFLESDGVIDVLQKGEKVDGRNAKGPIRYRLSVSDSDVDR